MLCPNYNKTRFEHNKIKLRQLDIYYASAQLKYITFTPCIYDF